MPGGPARYKQRLYPRTLSVTLDYKKIFLLGSGSQLFEGVFILEYYTQRLSFQDVIPTKAGMTILERRPI